MKQTYAVNGMMCASCVQTIERAVQQLRAVDHVTVNLATERMEVSGSDDLTAAMVEQQVQAAGYNAQLLTSSLAVSWQEQQAKKQAQLNGQKRKLLWLAGGAVILLGLMLLHMFASLSWGQTVASESLQLVLAAVIIVAQRHYFVIGFAALKRRQATMETLVALGSGIAFLASVVAYGNNLLTHATQPVYFDSAAIILVLVSVGKYLEQIAKVASSQALSDLIQTTVSQVEVKEGDHFVTKPASSLQQGAVVRVKAGDTIPADAKVHSGEITVNAAQITGESRPQVQAQNTTVLAGSSVIDGSAELTVTHAPAASQVAKIAQMVAAAQANKGKLTQLVDRIASVFVPTVLVLAVISTLAWWLGGGLTFAASLQVGVAVLVIACPCALGLATPLALLIATSNAAKDGVLVKNGSTLEHLAHIKHIVFDKTGTLTAGHLEIVDQLTAPNARASQAELTKVAAGLEMKTTHPFARAFLKAANDPTACTRFKTVKTLVGRGVAGKLNGQEWRIGTQQFAVPTGQIPAEWQHQLQQWHQYSVVYLSCAGTVQAAFALTDQVRSEAAQTVKQLQQMGIQLHLASGDDEAVVAAIAHQLGIEHYAGRQQPADKLALIKRLQANSTGLVAMVGDGINDTPALAQADIGIAVKNGADVALATAEVGLQHSSLAWLVFALNLSKATLTNIATNLTWAFAYNVLGIAVASGLAHALWGIGWLNPMIAALAMSLSSLSVIGNALRLRGQIRRFLPQSAASK